MKNIFIVRHGQSEANANERGLLSKEEKYVIDSNFGLTVIGKKQAFATGITIASKIDTIFPSEYNIYVSPYLRTRETATWLKRALINIGYTCAKNIEDPRLVEQDFGDFDFQYMSRWKEISPHSYEINQAKYHDPVGRFFARLENGEHLLDVYNRVSLFVATRLEKELNEKNVENHIIVTHGNTMRILRMYLLDMEVESFNDMQPPQNAGVYHIGYDKKTNKYCFLGEY